MPVIEPYLFFQGNCEEALNFYAECLGGSISGLMRYEGSPADQNLPPDWKQRVLHAAFKAPGISLMASDTPPQQATPPGGFALSLTYDNQDQGRKAFDALAAGGKVTLPFGPPFWGGQFGMCNDRFGVPWMVSTP